MTERVQKREAAGPSTRRTSDSEPGGMCDVRIARSGGLVRIAETRFFWVDLGLVWGATGFHEGACVLKCRVVIYERMVRCVIVRCEDLPQYLLGLVWCIHSWLGSSAVLCPRAAFRQRPSAHFFGATSLLGRSWLGVAFRSLGAFNRAVSAPAASVDLDNRRLFGFGFLLGPAYLWSMAPVDTTPHRTRRCPEWRPRHATCQFGRHGGPAIGELNVS